KKFRIACDSEASLSWCSFRCCEQAELARFDDCFLEKIDQLRQSAQRDRQALFGRPRYAIGAGVKLPRVGEDDSFKFFYLYDDDVAFTVLKKLADFDRLGEAHSAASSFLTTGCAVLVLRFDLELARACGVSM